MENEVRSTVEMFGLTKQQIKILYSLEYLLTKRDINSNQKDIIYKIMNPFTVRTVKVNDEDKYIVTVGRFQVHEGYFNTQEEAEKWLKSKIDEDLWMMIAGFVQAINEYYETFKTEKQ